jgi:hypothetical protein
MRQRAFCLLVAAVLLEACFSPNYRSGKTACSPAGECPTGFQCVSGLCYKAGEGPDLGPASGDFAGAGVCIYDHDNYDTTCVYAP